MMRYIAVILFCALAATPALSQSKKGKTPATVFTVNKKAVTTGEFIYLYRKNHQNKPEEFTREKIQEYLDLFINFKLKVEEARARGYDTTAAFNKEYNSYKEELRKPYLPDNTLSDSLARQTYERMKEDVNASHILIEVKADATPQDTLAAYNKIMDLRMQAMGGADFGKLASQYSEDPSARSNRGNLGYFTAMQMVYPFESAAYRTKTGEISMPVRTRFGYHLVKVEDRRPARGEVEVSHIMIRTGDGKDNDKTKNTIFEVYDQVRAGVKWEELCKQYSEDPGSKDNGGRLRPFGSGAMASVPAFEQVAFALNKPGDVSDPFQTQFGWHIMRLERKIPLAPYAEMATALKTRVNRDERTQISRQALQAKLRRDFDWKENAAAKTHVLAQADTSLRHAKWKAPAGYPDQEVLFTLQGKPVRSAEFLSYVAGNQRPSSQQPDKYFESLYNNFIDSRITMLLEERIMRNNPDFQMLLTEYYEGILLFDIMEKEVWNKASADSVGQEKFFRENMAKYKAGERARAVLYSASSRDTRDQLLARVQAGDTTQLDAYVLTNKLRTEAANFEKDEKAVISKVNWAKGVYGAENNGVFYVVWIKGILAPGSKTFQEARPSVISDYQGFLEKEWLGRLKKKFPVKLDKKGKEYVFSELLAKK
jgi:peptidyl-prolyl cis-trans isomerase SurA